MPETPDGTRSPPAPRPWPQRWIPSEERLRQQRGLRWMGPLLERRWLWHFSRRRVALGVGIGVFFGFLIPGAQIAGAALLALLLRANLPAAAVATFVSNPLTFVPITVAAYHTGSALLGESPHPDAEGAITTAMAEKERAADAGDPPAAPRWWERLRDIGKPLFLGLSVFAVVGGVGAWALVHAAWTFAVSRKRRRRTHAGR